ncbi:Transient receptor putative cation channel sub A member 1 [Homalodisca vitripennis]|nr:Transient receptor putative cation channel sub A member 1 [Homalodisca vitripennis]
MSIYHQVYSSDEDETLDNSTSPTSPNQPESVVNDLSDDDFVLAAESGNLEDFNRLFLAEPARLGVRDSKGRAAAHQAAARGKLNILQFIYSHGGAFSHCSLTMGFMKHPLVSDGKPPFHIFHFDTRVGNKCRSSRAYSAFLV